MPTSLTGLNALAWTLTSVALLLTFGRFWIRWSRLHKLSIDDYLNGVALAALLGFVATYQAYFPIQYAADSYVPGLGDYQPSDDQIVYSIKLELANIMLFWVAIFAVKASFLATYYYIFKVSSGFRKAWWCITVYTMLTFLAIFLGILWTCQTPSQFGDLQACTEVNLTLLINTQAYWIALNVSGDLLLIALPMVMLRKMFTISRSQNLALAGMFLVVGVDILFDILRTVYSVDAFLSSFIDANAAWDLCEPTVAVMVCALPSYRALFISPPRRRGPSYETMQEHAAGMGRNQRGPKIPSDYAGTELTSISNYSTRNP